MAKRSRSELDIIDHQILTALQRDGRMSITDLAAGVHLSVTPCTERVRRLEAQGYILGYHAHLNPVLLGNGLLAYVQVQLNSTNPDAFEKFKRAVSDCDEVLECHMVGGGFDYLLKIRVRDMAAYRHFLGDRIASIRGILQTHTYFVMEEVKSTSAIPVLD